MMSDIFTKQDNNDDYRRHMRAVSHHIESRILQVFEEQGYRKDLDLKLKAALILDMKHFVAAGIQGGFYTMHKEKITW